MRFVSCHTSPLILAGRKNAKSIVVSDHASVEGSAGERSGSPIGARPGASMNDFVRTTKGAPGAETVVPLSSPSIPLPGLGVSVPSYGPLLAPFVPVLDTKPAGSTDTSTT